MVQNISNRFLSLFFVLSIVSVKAQNIANYSKYRDSLLSSFSSFRSQTLSDYDIYRNQINADYVNFLNSAWDNFSQTEASDLPVDTNPVVPPVICDENIKFNPQPIITITPETLPEPGPQPSPSVPIDENNEQSTKKLQIILYGTVIYVSSPDISDIYFRSTQNQHLSDTWRLMADGRMDNCLSDCLSSRKTFNLNDWAYLCLLQNVGKKLFPFDSNLQVLSTAYLYANSGYKMRLGRNRSDLTILFASENLIYKIPYFNIDNDYFYPLKDIGSNLEICVAKFPSEQSLSLIINSLPLFTNNSSILRELKTSKGIVYQSCVNKNIISFYSQYPSSAINHDPLTRWALTCKAPLGETTKKVLYPQLKNQLANQSLYSQVNIILNFVQTAFKYENDDKIWSEDRALFSDEVLYYPYCDCEDRTCLFTRLVQDILGLDCAIVYYPGHLAAAVKFPRSQDIKGDKIKLDGDEYVICDPTYINSSVGMSMPEFKTSEMRAMILK